MKKSKMRSLHFKATQRKTARPYTDSHSTAYERRRSADRCSGAVCAGNPDESADSKDNRWSSSGGAAFTSFEEELKGADQIKSTFLTDIDKLFQTALSVPEIKGVILNPWNRTIMLDKHLIEIIMPKG